MQDAAQGNSFSFEGRLARSKGRPSRSRVANARVTASELKELEIAAESEAKALSEWSREVLLREARRPKNDPVFTEIVATRMMLNHVLRVIARGQVMTDEAFTYELDEVRLTKHETAREVMEQYAAPVKKEK